MTRETFLVVSAVVAFLVGTVALVRPQVLLASKGVAIDAPVVVWMRELGVAILAFAVISFLARDAADSQAMRAFLIGTGVLHLGLFPIEIAAWSKGTITRLSGIVPNSILHVVLSAGAFWFAAQT